MNFEGFTLSLWSLWTSLCPTKCVSIQNFYFPQSLFNSLTQKSKSVLLFHFQVSLQKPIIPAALYCRKSPFVWILSARFCENCEDVIWNKSCRNTVMVKAQKQWLGNSSRMMSRKQIEWSRLMIFLLSSVRTKSQPRESRLLTENSRAHFLMFLSWLYNMLSIQGV